MVRVKVLNDRGRVQNIFLQGRNLPYLNRNNRWTVEALLDSLKYFPGIEFSCWNYEWKVRGIWRPLTQLKSLLFLPRPPIPGNKPINKSGPKTIGPHFQNLEIYFCMF